MHAHIHTGTYTYFTPMKLALVTWKQHNKLLQVQSSWHGNYLSLWSSCITVPTRYLSTILLPLEKACAIRHSLW